LKWELTHRAGEIKILNPVLLERYDCGGNDDDMTLIGRLITYFVGYVLPYVAIVVFLCGALWRIWTWARSAVPLRIPTTPAPDTVPGVIGRMASEVLIFRSLFKGDRLLWLGGIAFHICLLSVLLRHLRYFLYPVPWFIVCWGDIAPYFAYFLPVPLLFLLIRRLTNERLLYISGWADWLPLLLLLSIVASGLAMNYYARVDLLAVKDYILSLMVLKPVPPPASAMFLTHFSLVMLLLIYLPFSKIMHLAGIFFSPTRNQRNNWRQVFVNPWDAQPRSVRQGGEVK